ncbi:MAG: glycerate dehydrogenase, partial [Pseudorhodoplanes sp.]|nr:glycerate dehydrogenase [Pseudorhodoplanes sp.]
MRPRIVFLDRSTIGPTVKLERPHFPHEWMEHGATRPDQVVERLAGAGIAVTNKVPIREEHLSALPHLRMIAVAAT